MIPKCQSQKNRESKITSAYSPRMSKTMELAIVGAHLSGFPLNHTLTDLNATFETLTTTSPSYRLYELRESTPAKPGLLRVSGDGACIEIEIWSMPIDAVGRFLDAIPSPLGLGSIEILDGRWVKGFICEPYGLQNARDITEFGGWRGFHEQR
jgi:hypothetical protein